MAPAIFLMITLTFQSAFASQQVSLQERNTVRLNGRDIANYDVLAVRSNRPLTNLEWISLEWIAEKLPGVTERDAFKILRKFFDGSRGSPFDQELFVFESTTLQEVLAQDWSKNEDHVNDDRLRALLRHLICNNLDTVPNPIEKRNLINLAASSLVDHGKEWSRRLVKIEHELDIFLINLIGEVAGEAFDPNDPNSEGLSRIIVASALFLEEEKDTPDRESKYQLMYPRDDVYPIKYRVNKRRGNDPDVIDPQEI